MYLIIQVVLLQYLILKLKLFVFAQAEALVNDVLHIYEFFHDVVKVEVSLQLAKVFIYFIEDIAVGLFLCLKLVIGLQSLILVTQVIKKALDKLVLDDPLVKQVLPDTIKLKLAGLVGAVYGLLKEDPELL